MKFFRREWSDAEKWGMGILAALIIAGLISLFSRTSPTQIIDISLPDCTVPSDDRKSCYRCDFPISENSAQSRFIERTCLNMPHSEEVAVKFAGTYFVTNRGPGSDCWLDNVLMRVDGTTTDRALHHNVLSCRVYTTRSTDFFKPKKPREATGAFQVAQCQWGADATKNCRLEGTLSIYTQRGQHAQ